MRILLKFLLGVAALNIGIDVLAQKCPSSSYTYCVSSGICYISDTIKQGYISYGADGHWNLIPFTNDKTDGTDIKFNCNSNLGDILYGKTKYCCYTATETEFKFTTQPSDSLPFDQYQNYFSTMRYGRDNRYFYRVINHAMGYCGNNYFGDPAYGSSKHCNTYSKTVPDSLATLEEEEWTFCGVSGTSSYCTGLDTAGAQWVRYGDNEQYYYRLVIATDGKVNCHANLFDDPKIGDAKYCWRAPAQPTFDNIVGEWVKLIGCAGCESIEYAYTLGITQLEDREITDSFEWSLSSTMEVSYEFAIGAGTSMELTAAVANEVTHRQLSSMEHTLTQQLTTTCTKHAMYQWQTGATQNNGETINQHFKIESEEFKCLDGTSPPQCPPGYCADDNCQSCTTDIEK